VQETTGETYTKHKTNIVKAVAHANIALVKYWGKRNIKLNLPAVGSVSMTLDALKTETTVQLDDSFRKDKFILNENLVPVYQTQQITRFLDLLSGTPDRTKLLIKSRNNFPTGAGLASSASGFAALTLAASQAYGKQQGRKELSRIARQGSGSAPRSLFGGFVEMKCGKGTNDENDYAVQLHDSNYWDIRMLIAITSTEKKTVSSTEGMIRTADTSPFYSSWISSSDDDIKNMKQAITDKDFEKMGELAEHSSFKMHGLALSAQPPLLYWNAITIETIHKIRKLRGNGIQAYITMDAGPQVKILCLPEDSGHIQTVLESVSGMKKVITASPGPDAHIGYLN